MENQEARDRKKREKGTSLFWQLFLKCLLSIFLVYRFTEDPSLPKPPTPYAISCVEINQEGNKIISGGLDGLIRVWDIGMRKELGQYRCGAQVLSFSLCPQDNWVTVG